jgi:molybdate transport system substrate-binding protein
MTSTVRGISSMATKQVLAALASAYAQQTGTQVAIESVGGVDAARRVQDGEPFDVVFLASDAIDKLIAAGHAIAGTRVDLVRSEVAIAVQAGAPQPAIGSEQELKQSVLAAASIGYSTGPSGAALLKLFERWGIAEQVRDRLVQAKPGIPVGSMVASGDVALGFQQRSELIHLPGIAIVGPLPAPVQIVTTFSGAAVAGTAQVETVRALLAFMAAPAAADAKTREGMSPA